MLNLILIIKIDMLFNTALTATIFSAYGISLNAAQENRNEAWSGSYTYEDYNTGYNNTGAYHYSEGPYGTSYSYSFDDSEAPAGDITYYYSGTSADGNSYEYYSVADGATGQWYSSSDGYTWSTYDENWN